MITPKSLQQLKDRLENWNTTLAPISLGLYEVSNLGTYQNLEKARKAEGPEGSGAPVLTGITRQKGLPALQSINEVFQDFAQLQQLIDDAKANANNIKPFLTADAKLTEIEKMLDGPPSWKPGAGSIQDLINRIPTAYRTARDVIDEINKAAEGLLAKLSTYNQRMESIVALAEQLSVSAPEELHSAQSKLEWARKMVQSDPLGAVNSLDNLVGPLVNKAEQKLNALKQQHDVVTNALASAATRIQDILALTPEIEVALVECRLKFDSATEFTEPLAESDEAIEQLTNWLNKLNGLCTQGKWQPVAAGLAQWNKQADVCLNHQKEALASTRGKLEKLQLIRCMYPTLKIEVSKHKLSNRKTLEQLGQEIEERLFVKPSPIDELTHLFETYEAEADKLMRKSRSP